MGVRIAIVGAGSIGVGWAIVFVRVGLDVVVHDPHPEAPRRVPKSNRASSISSCARTSIASCSTG
jgi:3-hydroxyacyl-CoA dehydrogenase